ncbi:rhomboid family intramembrane serine protease [Stieleria varia]|uniref:Rhomboid family protein n=1 Tax=Stieleria varia TaxID=2528005 RepID=A0A5C6B1F2_9BACT|nr:rhomboid family intramembrane serine protease [Stieleria varia]TWU04254.1 Rhomboid family protein [Stieleria varia]
MIVPYSTDAPLYHWPITTISLIVVNVVLYFTTTFQFHLGNLEEESVTWLILNFDTINPLQWLTAQFMHADLMHLLGNMFFLFAFGLIVEGKIGNLPFLGLYLVIAFIDGAVTQVPMYFISGEGAALGASGVIFAVLTIAVLWAPENELDCFYLVFLYWGTFEARVITFGGIYIAIQFLLVFLSQSMSSEMLHVIGILIGLPIGFAMLRLGMVDCEGWDVISRNEWLHDYPLLYSPEKRQQDKQGVVEVYDPVGTALALEGAGEDARRRLSLVSNKPAAASASASASPTVASPTANATASLSPQVASRPSQMPNATRPGVSLAGAVSTAHCIDPAVQQRAQSHPEYNRLAFLFRQGVQQKNLFSAQQAFLQLDRLQLTIGLNEQSLMQYVTLLGSEKRWVDVVRPLSVIASQHGALAVDAMLRLAQVQLRVLNRADQAIATLRSIPTPPPETITDSEQQKIAKRDELLATAQRIASHQQ